jgi:hypothetical protein
MRRSPALFVLALSLVANACGGNKAPAARRVALEFERLAALPSTADEFAGIFKRQPTASQLAATRAAATRAQQAGVQLLPALAASGTVADFVVERLRNPFGPKVLTLIGHNEGGLFRFADGSSIALNQLPTLAPGKLPVAISCESARYSSGLQLGFASPITVQVAQLTESLFVGRLNALAQEGQAITPAAAQAQLEAALAEAVHQLRVETIVKVATPGVVGVAIWENV